MNGQRTNTGITGNAPGYWAYPVQRKGTQQHQPGYEESGESTETIPETGNSFLNTVIKPIPVTQTSLLYSQENYMYLYESAKNYAKLLGKEFSPEADPNNFTALYRRFAKILPESHELDLTAEEDDLYFIVTDNRADELTYFIPLKIIGESKGRLKNLYHSFFALFRKYQAVTPFDKNTLLRHYVRDSAVKNRKEWETTKYRYTKGKISRIFESLWEEPEFNPEELIQQIRTYKARKVKTKTLLKLMQEGLELFEKGNIFDHRCSPIEDQYYYESYCPVDMRNLISFIYDPDDMMTHQLTEFIKEEAEEQGYEFLISEYKRLSPHDEKPLEESHFLISFMNWIKRFNYELRNI